VTGRPDLVFLTDWLPPDFGAVGQYSLLRTKMDVLVMGNWVLMRQ
jgi:hypothetical protein